MQACQWENRQAGKEIDVLGIVTNGQGWILYKLAIAGLVYETGMYTSDDMPKILGSLHTVF
jgi:hypothetical protein